MTKQKLSDLVDAIGELKAKLAPHLDRLADLESQIKGQGPGTYRGVKWEATVTQYDRTYLDMDAVRGALSRQFLKAHSEQRPVTRVNVTARKTPSVKKVA